MKFFAILFLWSTAIIACDQHGMTGLLPENDLYIGTEALDANLTEKDFNEVIDRATKIYAPIIKDLGANLVFYRYWNDGTVNAYAQRNGNTWIVSMYGGLARHNTVTKDAFALVVCHELGHHIGGAPKKNYQWSSWASNEGQADYFGTLKCMRRLLEEEDNSTHIQTVEIPEIVTKTCGKNFEEKEENAVCQRNSMAGMSLGNLFRALMRTNLTLKFDTPDPNVVTRTNDNHPKAQCRLDTYYQGSLCDRRVDDDVSQTDVTEGVCTRAKDYKHGLRPLCWYLPPK